SEAAGWIFNTPLEVLITEISDAESSQSKIEVYNPWYPPINMNVGFGFTTDSGTLDGTWSIWEVDSGEYAVLDVTTILGLNPEGDTLTLYQYGFFIDEISYGQKGIVPDPLPNESVQRYWDGTVYTDVWERNYTTGTTFGSENDVPPLNISSKLRLNEILFNPTTKTDAFIELILLFGRIDISGYKIVGDSEYIIPQGTELIPGDDIFYLVYSDDSDFFDALNPQGDNVYLYDANGSLVDMAGWSSLHTKGKSMNRIPEGNGTRDGYDDSSSRAAGWVFDCLPSIQYVKAYTIEPKKYGPFGDVIYFDVTVTNKQQVSDTVLLFTSSLYGYPAVIFDETRTHYISEVFLQAGSSVNISILVILPSEVPLVDTDNISITVQSDNITMYRDTIIIQAIVTPFVWPEKSISPSEIYYSGTGYDEVTTITLNLTGYGSVIEFVQPQDVIFCVDTSGSMTSQAIELIKQGLFGYVDEMRPQDRGAVVIFNSGAWLVNPLTNDHNALRNDIFGIPGPGGSTFMGEALKVAIDELLANGNESHIHVIILLTDGGWNGLMDPVVQAERAAAHNIIIFTIGLEPAPPNRLDEPTLREIADITGGQYFYAQDANQIPDIYKIIAKYIGDIAGRDIDVLDANPMIRDVLPPWIILVDNSFSIEPDINYVDETGYRILEWNLSSIFIGEIWEVTFQVKSTKLGQVHTNDLHNSRISYVDYFDMEYVRLFPECTAIVLPPRPLPPKLYIDLLPNEDDILLYWDKSPTPGIDHYLLYQAESPTGFDFSSPWINTSVDIDPLDTRPKPGPVGNRLSWNHTNAQDPATPQYYYCIRAVNILYQTSFTSRTVGKWTKTFLQGVSTFSLPLEPLEIMTPTADFFLMDMNADYIKWVNPTTHFWMKHGEGEVNDVLLEVGSGYEVAFPTATDYTFLGMPGAMIRHKDGEFSGFDYNSDARSLWAVASPATGDVMLSWDEPDDMDPNGGYNVYFATTRDGFDDGTATFLTFVPASARKTVTHFNAAQPGSQHYYMVVPVNESAGEGASTYSVGVFCAFYQAEYDTLAIPLRISMDYNADWFCDNIPDCVGINYYDMGEQRWNWHSKRMPEGAYDTNLVMTEGYQISTAADTKYTFVGH
ncbi:MAG: VWA domain-containing protein, partial [Thermoplasmata archaeon]